MSSLSTQWLFVSVCIWMSGLNWNCWWVSSLRIPPWLKPRKLDHITTVLLQHISKQTLQNISTQTQKHWKQVLSILNYYPNCESRRNDDWFRLWKHETVKILLSFSQAYSLVFKFTANQTPIELLWDFVLVDADVAKLLFASSRMFLIRWFSFAWVVWEKERPGD